MGDKPRQHPRIAELDARVREIQSRCLPSPRRSWERRDEALELVERVIAGRTEDPAGDLHRVRELVESL